MLKNFNYERKMVYLDSALREKSLGMPKPMFRAKKTVFFVVM
jgi:hypothetical protein